MKELIIVGDFDPANPSHQATNDAIGHSTAALKLFLRHQWIATDEVARPGGREQLQSAAGLWIAPASPYRSLEGALSAIRLARERRIPLLGTCGGFQHIVLEYARNVLGFSDAEHGETNPDAARLFISRLQCSLVGRALELSFRPGSLIGKLYGQPSARENYYCNFGVNPAFAEALAARELKITASDAEGEVRAVELTGHPFFLGTLFLPQLRSTAAEPHPVVTGFLQACARDGGTKSDPRGQTTP